MIVHVVPNHRFVGSFPGRFEAAFPNDNLWFVIDNSDAPVCADSKLVRNIAKDAFWTQFRKHLSSQADLVCVHCLDGDNTRIALELVDEGYKVLPFLWAGEYTSLLSENPLQPYLPRTKGYVLGRQTIAKSLYYRLLDVSGGRLAWVKASLSGENKLKLQQLRLLNEVSHFVSPVKEEAEIIIRKNSLSSQFLRVQYSWLDEEVFDFRSAAGASQGEIQVGHSGWAMNNHLDVFDLLSRERLKSRSVVCTLAYGDPHYLKFIEREGRARFTNEFRAVKDFVPRSEYFKGMQDVSAYIAAQRNQFGLGNVKNLIAMGKRVVMPRENPMFSNLKSLGVELSDLRDDSFSLEPLSATVAQSNQEIAAHHWGRDYVIRESQDSFQVAITS